MASQVSLKLGTHHLTYCPISLWQVQLSPVLFARIILEQVITENSELNTTAGMRGVLHVYQSILLIILLMLNFNNDDC